MDTIYIRLLITCLKLMEKTGRGSCIKKNFLVKLWMDKILHKLVGVYGICLGFPKITRTVGQSSSHILLFILNKPFHM